MQYFPPEEFPPVPQKPPLVDLPPIWAQSRQEICESFDWFRSYQGGVYHAHDIVKGYLLSGFPSSRDRFEHGGRLIISHGGGKSESMHFSKGHVSCVLASDQLAQDKSVRALLNNYRSNRPLALLIDDKYALFPYDLGSKDVAYAVLGFYTVAHVWAEYQVANNESGRVVRYKFAFRWCEDQGWPWWIERSNFVIFLPTKYSTSHRDEEVITCGYCQEVSPRVFSLCWVCLTPHCRMFWRQTEGECSGHCLPDGLDYHPSFLKLPPCKTIPSGFQIIKPFLPTETSPSGTITNYFFTRGFHCAECGRLSCRYVQSQWEKWQCAHCNNPLRTESTLCHATDIWNQALPITFKDNLLNAISDITQSSSASFIHEGGRGLIHSFILPERRGRIHHIQSGTPNGWKEADDIFLEYQKQASSGTLRFRRWPMRAVSRGALLTNYFSHNGEPSEILEALILIDGLSFFSRRALQSDANTVPFDSAPAVCKARGLIQKRIKQALGISAEFNEVLSVAYMERQKMAGDVLVMDGAGVQEYYEHTVVPNNFRIAATARQIGSTHA
ncbi:hypothetical protein BDZ97DRAFT_1648790 [Flammula alnicola]|nr:hypothetical protein BDZ97DRAFT_1648790 [Flammula alnicola]